MMDTPGDANPQPDMPNTLGPPQPTYPPVRSYLVSAGRVLLLVATVAFLLVCALLSIAITVPRLSRPVGAPALPTRTLPSVVLPTATLAIAGSGTPVPPPTPTPPAGGPPPAPTAGATDSPFVTPTAFPTVTPSPSPTDAPTPIPPTPSPTIGSPG